MKAQPVKLIEGKGYVGCPVDEATHVTIHIPGPSGKQTLPVILQGTRSGTGCWSWNGDMERPTLKPSILKLSGHYFTDQHKPGDPCWCSVGDAHFKCFRCHTWINDGRAQFLPDSSHELAGQTLELLEVEP